MQCHISKSPLHFADDITIIAQDANTLKDMLQELAQHSEAVRLKMNMSKTKVMFNKYCQQHVIRVNSNKIEAIMKYVYLGHLLEKNHSIKEELHCCIRAVWAAYNRPSNILESKPILMSLKRKAFNQCVITCNDLHHWDLVPNKSPDCPTTNCTTMSNGKKDAWDKSEQTARQTCGSDSRPEWTIAWQKAKEQSGDGQDMLSDKLTEAVQKAQLLGCQEMAKENEEGSMYDGKTN